MRQRPATVRQVAAAADVSIATVSRVLSESGGASPAVAKRVRRIAEEMGYQPNLLARNLAQGRKLGVVGVLVPDIENPYFSALVKSIMHCAARDQCKIIVADSDDNPAREPEIVQDLRRWVDGLILVAPRRSTRKLKDLNVPGLPTVWLETEARFEQSVCITTNSHEAMLSLAGHLIEQGHQRLCYLRGPQDSWQDLQRWKAIDSICEDPVSATSVPCGGTIAGGYAATDHALATGATALLAFNDLAAFGTLARCRELGVRVPADISLTGFDDISFREFAEPLLTTIRAPLAELGSTAWSAIQQLLAGRSRVVQASLTPQIVFGNSTGPAPAGSPAGARPASPQRAAWATPRPEAAAAAAQVAANPGVSAQ